jgi:thiosulfate dehydrogenase
VAALVKDPARDPLPSDAHEAEQVRLGYAIVRDSRRNAGRFVGNDLACANCHLNAGQRDRGLPFVGVAGTFPQYRARDGRLISLQDRIADCFERSLNGTAPPFDSPEMMAVSAYITWLSHGMPVGESPAWRGKNSIARENLIPIERLDVAQGGALYQQQCAVCHGQDGQGVDLRVAKPGPLWGPGSWNDGAGAARVYTLAGYIRYAMPLTAPGSLTDEQAQLIAAFVNSHDRPAFALKAKDYPNGDVPVDAVYYPRYPENPLRASAP